MTGENTETADWDPRSPQTLRHQIAEYDRMRATCPVAHDADGHWSVFSHGDVVDVLNDHETFSNRVSVHVAVPNGMDPPEHTGFRAIVDSYYTPERMTAFEPVLRDLTRTLLDNVPRGTSVEVMSTLADPFAAWVQSAFMGWPTEMHEPLMTWVKENHAAVLSQDRERISQAALTFDSHIRKQLDSRRGGEPRDITGQLMTDTVDGRLLTDDEIVAIIRNWTVGELGTIAASVGIILEFLAANPSVLEQLRTDPSLAVAASDEILRIHPPLIANRRRAARDVTLGGRSIPAEARVNVVWASANRDESVFGDPDEFRLDRDPELNLLYGVGVHYCPGAPLARLEFQVLLEEFLARFDTISLVADTPPERAIFPASGWSQLHLQFT